MTPHSKHAIRPTRSEKRNPLYIEALTGKLTESDLSPDWYQNQKRKEKTILRDSKVNHKTVWPDELWGYLQPIIHRLNQGKEIKPGSHEHKALKELLDKAEGNK